MRDKGEPGMEKIEKRGGEIKGRREKKVEEMR